VASRDVSDVHVSDPIDVRPQVRDEVPLGNLLMVQVVEESHVWAVHRVDYRVHLLRGRQIDSEVVDDGVYRFDQQDHALFPRLLGHPSQHVIDLVL
jgi:hypothetical protein